MIVNIRLIPHQLEYTGLELHADLSIIVIIIITISNDDYSADPGARSSTRASNDTPN